MLTACIQGVHNALAVRYAIVNHHSVTQTFTNILLLHQAIRIYTNA